MIRGVSRQLLFEDHSDYGHFMKTLERFKEQCAFNLYAFCLMDNHVHLLIKANQESIGATLQRLEVSYSHYFNQKYQRCGHLFESRFKSEPVETLAYFLALLRYIHLNPVKAGLCRKPADYIFSSYRAYLKQNPTKIVDRNFVSEQFAGVEDFASFHENADAENVPSTLGKHRNMFSDQEVLQRLKSLSGCQSMSELQRLEKSRCMKSLRVLRQEKVSITQLARVTGISYNTIRRNT
jgi:REP element-mobilizing transposase RayT